MKKVSRITLIVALAVMVLMTSVPFAFAAQEAPQFSALADELKALGLFQGTQNGYELERAATRTEASVMLVRLLGKEAEAKAGTYEIPFTDVAEWAKPYVGYMYEAGLTKGVSETSFGSATLCDAKMYSTFLLRSLGYSEADGDFTYAESAAYATTKGIVDPALTGGAFLRDQVAAASYNALGANLKDAETCLLQKLVDEGAVTAEAAKPMLDKITAFYEFEKVNKAYEGIDMTSMDGTIKGFSTITMEGVATDVPIDMQIKTKITGTNIEYASTTNSTVSGEAISVNTYMKDGFMYINDGENKIKLAANMTGFDPESMGLEQYMTMGTPLYMYDSITSKTSGANTVYSITFSPAALNNLANSIVSSMLPEGASMEITSYSTDVEVDKDSMIKTMKMSFGVSGNIEGVAMAMKYDMTLTINAIGDKVSITFPDFSEYVLAE